MHHLDNLRDVDLSGGFISNLINLTNYDELSLNFLCKIYVVDQWPVL